MMTQGCPNDDQLAAFAEGQLDPAQRSAVEEHLAGCTDCSAVVSATFAESLPPEHTKVGRYQVVAEIGRGGMGRVLRARDPSLGRDVAIKSILPSALSPAAKERFAREAVVLGTLRHPNVIEVFDAGELEGAPYFVMEFIEGQDLDQWCKDRPVREVLDCLCGAGRGLAAAHAKGILHRDFKPSNVIVGRDDRAKVGDFGLATFGGGSSVRTDGASVDTLTQTGALMGTLPYMAPELLEGGRASELSDQFAFCVTMYEVLYGQRPFAGKDPWSLAEAIRSGEIRDGPAAVAIPRRAHRALVRGLSPEPSGRFPSMRALLAELHPRRRVALRVGAGLAATGAVVAVAAAVGSTTPSVCDTFAERLSGVYDSRVRSRIRSAFADSDLPYAETASRGTLEGLDAYAERWAAGAKESCGAAQRGELSDVALDLRVRCFKHSAQSVEAMVGLLQTPQTIHIESSRELLAALPNLAVCTDAEALRRFGVLPANAAEAAEADALGAVLSEAHAQALVDDFDGAWDVLERNAEALAAASYPPVRSRTLALRARVLLARKDLEASRDASVQAHELTMEHRLDREASRTATFLGRIASRTGDVQGAHRWFDLALALAESGGFTQLQAHTLSTASRFYQERGELQRAVQAARRAVQLIEDDDAYPETSRAEVLLAYSDRLLSRGGRDDGLAQLQRAHEILLAVHGDTHPAVGDVQRSLQERASRRGDYDASYRHGREVLRITMALDGPTSLRAVAASANLAISLRELGRFAEAARELAHANTLLDQWPAYVPMLRIPILTNLGSVMLGLGDNDGARDALTRAKALFEAQENRKEQGILVDGLLSAVELRDDNLAAARSLAAGALAASTEVYGGDNFHTADAGMRLAHVELAAGNYALARDLLAGALAVQDINEADRGEMTFGLARATYEDPRASPRDRARGLELARDAKLALQGKPAYGRQQAEVALWLRQRSEDSCTGCD